MISPLNLFLIEHDGLHLELCRDLTWVELGKIVEVNGAIIWDRLGELRIIMPDVLADTYRVGMAQADLTKLGRDLATPRLHTISLDQTYAITSNALAQLGTCKQTVPPPPPLR